MAREAQPSVPLMFLPHFDVLCDLLLNRRTATWNLFVLYNKDRGPVAQLVEQRFAMREVVSSTLAGPTLRVLK